jgi:hypothetical protein
MNPVFQKLPLPLVATVLAGPLFATAQDTIIYSNGPSFPIPSYYDSGRAFIDFDGDGVFDLSFEYYGFICTADVPTSGCSLSFYVGALSTNAILVRSCQASILPFGTSIGSAPASNTMWNTRCQYTALADYFFSPRYGTKGYGGPLADPGVGYLGVRFSAADGLHYGWVRVRMPRDTEFAPAIVDWAYEARPDTAIRAGAIGSKSESRQFAVNFQDSPRTAEGTPGSGTLILTGDTLRCELILFDSFASAAIVGPAASHSNARPLATLEPPLVARTNYTAFFTDVSLSHADIVQLLRGMAHVNVDPGAVVGRISLLP